jgi:hypothetical protein
MAERLRDQFGTDDFAIESVFPRERFESLIADPEQRSLYLDLLHTGDVSLYLVDDSIPCYVARHDDRAVLDVPSATGSPVVRLTTDQQAVLDWVDAILDEFRERADPVAPGDLAE